MTPGFGTRIDPDMDRGARPRGLVGTCRKPEVIDLGWDLCWLDADGSISELNDLWYGKEC